MAHVVGFIGQKGGTGKSGLAQAFAVQAAKEADNVMIADLDGDQQTSVEWGKAREANGYQPFIEVKSVPRLRVFDLATTCDVLVIDAPGWADELSVWLAKGCHLTVLPSKPTVTDLNPTIRLMHELRAKLIRNLCGSIRGAGIDDDDLLRDLRRTGEAAAQIGLLVVRDDGNRKRQPGHAWRDFGASSRRAKRESA